MNKPELTLPNYSHEELDNLNGLICCTLLIELHPFPYKQAHEYGCQLIKNLENIWKEKRDSLSFCFPNSAKCTIDDGRKIQLIETARRQFILKICKFDPFSEFSFESFPYWDCTDHFAIANLFNPVNQLSSEIIYSIAYRVFIFIQKNLVLKENHVIEKDLVHFIHKKLIPHLIL